jgi:hypothetical protein
VIHRTGCGGQSECVQCAGRRWLTTRKQMGCNPMRGVLRPQAGLASLKGLLGVGTFEQGRQRVLTPGSHRQCVTCMPVTGPQDRCHRARVFA